MAFQTPGCPCFGPEGEPSAPAAAQIRTRPAAPQPGAPCPFLPGRFAPRRRYRQVQGRVRARQSASGLCRRHPSLLDTAAAARPLRAIMLPRVKTWQHERRGHRMSGRAGAGGPRSRSRARTGVAAAAGRFRQDTRGAGGEARGGQIPVDDGLGSADSTTVTSLLLRRQGAKPLQWSGFSVSGGPAVATRVIAYIDGFNLYHGIRNTPYRWLDPGRSRVVCSDQRTTWSMSAISLPACVELLVTRVLRYGSRCTCERCARSPTSLSTGVTS